MHNNSLSKSNTATTRNIPPICYFKYIIFIDNTKIFNNCLHSKNKKILKYKKLLEEKDVSECHWVTIDSDVCSCCNIPFRIKGHCDRKKLYVLLPDENVYVCAEEWNNMYMKSRTRYLINIFEKIGISEIDIEIFNKSDNLGDINDYGINTDKGIEIEEIVSENNMKFILTFQNRRVTNTLDTKTDIDYIYNIMDDPDNSCLRTNVDWIDYINGRIVGKKTNIIYRHKFRTYLNLSEKCINELNKIGIITKLSNNNLYEYIDMNTTFIH